MTAVDTSLEVLEALDFDHRPGCDIEACEREASWRERNLCCGARWLICGPHAAAAIKCLERAKAGLESAVCSACGARLEGPERVLFARLER